MELSIIIPCYNEAANLPALIARIRNVIMQQFRVEVILVDNGSRDDTLAVLARELAQGEGRIRTVVVPVNQGYGYGILQGLHAARGAVLAWTHADCQTDPADVLEAYRLWQRQPDNAKCFVRGRRTGRPLFDRLFTAGMSTVSTLLLRTPLRDINAQPKLFPRAFLNQMATPPKDFSLDVYALAMANKCGYRVLEIPVQFGKRTAGEAKGGGSFRGKIKLTKRTLAYLWKLRKSLSVTVKPNLAKRAA